jgi:hypothetical protein
MVYENASSYSSATQVSTALVDKVDKTEYATFSATTNTSIEDLSGQSETVATALNDLNAKKLDTTAYTPVDTSLYYKKTETSGATEIQTALNGKVDITAFTSHTGSSVHMTTTEKTNLDSLATNIAAISGITATKVNNWDDANTKKHTHSNKTALDSITGNVGTMVYEDKTSYSSATEVNTALVNKANTSDLNLYADAVMYNDTTKYVEFYHGTTAGTKVFEFNAAPFIIDGMVQNVEVKDVTSGGSQVTCLVISFNTDAGKQDINIPLTDIFDASNYYTKSQTSGATELSTAFDAIDDLVGSGFTSSSITDVIVENEEIVSSALNDLDERKLDASAYTPVNESSGITAMTGYAMAASGTPISTSDTLNAAIGKLEKMIDELKDYIEQKELAIAAAITDLDNRLKALE